MLNTAQRIILAKIAYKIIMLLRNIVGKGVVVNVKRGGINWKLDLKEGIDFSIYLLGGFEPSTLHLYKKVVKQNDIVLDIGANIGSHTLPLASLVGETGMVIAFEPTTFAINKLIENVSNNPDLRSSVVVRKQMLMENIDSKLESSLYSSWPLEGDDNVHEKHKGSLMNTDGASVTTLDAVIDEMGIRKVDFIKLDVDGYEYSVLAGGVGVLYKYEPTILMELAPYLFKGKPELFEGIVKIFSDLNYKLYDVKTNDLLPLDPEKLYQLIPDGASRNILAKTN